MCDGKQFIGRSWMRHAFATEAQSGRDGFDRVTSSPGVYILRATQPGLTDIEKIKRLYLSSPFMQAVASADKASEAMFAKFGWGTGWGWTEKVGACERLKRLNRISFRRTSLACRVLYIGKANNLQRRMRELAYYGHTINHAFWALNVAGWRFEVALKPTSADRETQEEARLKDLFKRAHDGHLPALVER
jgi:hypothetical protein